MIDQTCSHSRGEGGEGERRRVEGSEGDCREGRKGKECGSKMNGNEGMEKEGEKRGEEWIGEERQRHGQIERGGGEAGREEGRERDNNDNYDNEVKMR